MFHHSVSFYKLYQKQRKLFLIRKKNVIATPMTDLMR